MPFIKLSLVFGLSLISWSEDAPVSEAPSGQLSKDRREYMDKSSKLTTLNNRIAESHKQLNALVIKKAAAKSPQEVQAVLKEMVDLSNNRNKDVETYNKLKSELTLRYPHKGTQLNRVYQTHSKRTLEELEGVAGLDEMLTRIRKLIEVKYAPFNLVEEIEASKKPKVAFPDPETPTRLRLEK